jgi:mRNA interferase MazF
MTNYDAGDIVLVHYPFTDGTSLKRRPAVIVSPQEYTARFGDVVLMPLTSQREQDTALALTQWKASGLIKPTWIKPIIGTLSTRLIEKRLGQLAASDNSCVKAALRVLLSSRWT